MTSVQKKNEYILGAQATPFLQRLVDDQEFVTQTTHSL